MLILSTYHQLDNLCFSDFDVERVIINKDKKIFKLYLEGVWLIEGGVSKELGAGNIEVINFDQLTAYYSNSILKKTGSATTDQVLQIREINEHQVGSNFFKFYGFIDDGSWLECKVTGGDLKAMFSSKT